MPRKKENQRQKRDKWYHRSVVYHIYPRSFKDSGDDGIGDLEGIIEKLDYLNDGTENSLGVGAIWVSPIYKSPMADYGYDVSDYTDIDPIFGNLKTFDKLVSEAKKRKIKIIMDLVINHTSIEHKWFKEARSSQNNPKRDWFVWRHPKPDGSPPNNWLSVFGGPAWTLDEKTNQYYFHSFLPEQPDLNWRNKEVQKAIKEVANFWLKRGVDGFRVDAIEHLIEDSDFRDEPDNPDYVAGKGDPYRAFQHIYTKGHKDLKSYVNNLCEIVGEFDDRFIVSEAYIDIPQMMDMYQYCNKKIYAPFNFNLMHKKWNASEYKKFIDDFETALTPDDWPNYVFGNHDRSRITSRLKNENQARIAGILLLTLRGMPFIYYGDEIGMKDAKIPKSKIKDKFAKKIGDPNFSRDPERTPMQWNDSLNAGFSTAEPWLPIGKDYKKRNVETESKNPKSILNLYKTLIHYRNKSETLMIGSYWSLEPKSKNILSYMREYEGKKVLVMLNFSSKKIKEPLPVDEAKIILSSFMDKTRGTAVSGNVELRPNEGFIFEIN